MTMVERLLWLAEDLNRRSIELRSPTIERRAVSTAYYAVFHALMSLCAKELLGVDGDTRKSVEYERVYRALDHGSLKAAFKSHPLKDMDSLRRIGESVVELQSERIRSDYLPPGGRLYKKTECARLVGSAKSAVKMLAGLSASERRSLAVFLIFKNRSS
jgi:uncharacterized protein (UPF0332 family)